MSLGLLARALRHRIAPVWVDVASPAQAEMLVSTERRKAAVCGRRAGKTWCVALALVDAALRFPGTIVPYMCLTQRSARYIALPVFREVEKALRVGLEFRESPLEISVGESHIPLLGCDNVVDMDRLRGGKYPRAVVDEAGSFPRSQLGYLVDEVLEPALGDLRGDLWMVGTPNAACRGYFFDATRPPWEPAADVAPWPTWEWDARQNPFFPDAEALFAEIREKHRWTEQTPAYRREYLGQWIRDESSLVYRFDRARNGGQPPAGLGHHVLAIDLGAAADSPTTAYVVLGQTPQRVWCVWAEVRQAQGPDDIAETVKRLDARFGFERIVCDAGALGAGYVRHLQERHRIPVEAAEKRDKLGHVAALNGDFDRGRLWVDVGSCGPLVEQLETLQWDEERKAPDPRFPDHCCDALLYGWRTTYAYTQPEPGPVLSPGSAEALRAERDALRARLAKKKRATLWER